MSRLNYLLLVGLLTLGVAAPAFATVEALFDVTIITRHRQADALCYREVPVVGEFGIPAAVAMEAVTTAYRVPRIPAYGSNADENLNVLAEVSGLETEYVADGVGQDGALEYSMRVDVRALAAQNGASVSGREATVRTAKLVLLAMAKNLDGLSGGFYRLRVEFVGLPSQLGLTGSRLYPTTRYAYSAASSLLARYEQELIGPHCN